MFNLFSLMARPIIPGWVAILENMVRVKQLAEEVLELQRQQDTHAMQVQEWVAEKDELEQAEGEAEAERIQELTQLIEEGVEASRELQARMEEKSRTALHHIEEGKRLVTQWLDRWNNVFPSSQQQNPRIE